MSEISKTTTNEQKTILRGIKKPSGAIFNRAKAEVYRGCNDPRATMQFNEDLRLYGLWEALLYVENYETDGSGSYVTGTAEKAVQAAIRP